VAYPVRVGPLEARNRWTRRDTRTVWTNVGGETALTDLYMGPNVLANRRPAAGAKPRMRDVRVERRVRPFVVHALDC